MHNFSSMTVALLASAGALAFYLSAAGQTWLRRPFAARPGRFAAALLLIAAVGAGMASLHPATALAIVVTCIMAWLTACPFIGAWLNRTRTGTRTGARTGRARPMR